MLEKDFHGDIIERRMVKPHAEYDPMSIPPEWLQWLQKTRDKPPTKVDIMQAEDERNAQMQRAVTADAVAADAAFRWQQQENGSSRNDVSDFTQQLGQGSEQSNK